MSIKKNIKEVTNVQIADMVKNAEKKLVGMMKDTERNLVGMAQGSEKKLVGMMQDVEKGLQERIDSKVGSVERNLENLAAMTQRGFEEVHGRIDREVGGLGKELRTFGEKVLGEIKLLRNDTEAGFESVDMRFDKLEERLTLTNDMVSDHEIRITTLERKAV